MSKLLSANLMRLKKDKVFWIAFGFMFAAGIIFPVMIYRDMVRTGIINTIDNVFFHYAMFIGILMAVFCSFFVGTEYIGLCEGFSGESEILVFFVVEEFHPG